MAYSVDRMHKTDFFFSMIINNVVIKWSFLWHGNCKKPFCKVDFSDFSFSAGLKINSFACVNSCISNVLKCYVIGNKNEPEDVTSIKRMHIFCMYI